MNRRAGAIAAALAVTAIGGGLRAAPRDVQIRTIDIEAGVIELFNFGVASEPLDGWQFCTFDANESFKYTGSAGLNGESIAQGGSLFVHTLNDAPPDPDPAKPEGQSKHRPSRPGRVNHEGDHAQCSDRYDLTPLEMCMVGLESFRRPAPICAPRGDKIRQCPAVQL
ncbi:MAG: lamin tail domain-containing protein [bacterium]|nr:lamin tail domain-containing protein [bacterium]